ncbi:MAG TPA: hypothetical protein VFF39_09815 [Verrucomicrobiae bacterium]|jgi:hypothetical protein|nr:hypothetical protein [Verrucomicrobiae bacterium]
MQTPRLAEVQKAICESFGRKPDDYRLSAQNAAAHGDLNSGGKHRGTWSMPQQRTQEKITAVLKRVNKINKTF